MSKYKFCDNIKSLSIVTYLILIIFSSVCFIQVYNYIFSFQFNTFIKVWHYILVYLNLIWYKTLSYFSYHCSVPFFCISYACYRIRVDDFGTLRIRSAIVRSRLNIRVNHSIPDVLRNIVCRDWNRPRDVALLVYVTRLSAALNPTTCANWLIKSRKLLFPRHVAPTTPSAYSIRI